MTPTLKAPGTKHLKLNYDEPPSSFAFTFNLRHYTMELCGLAGVAASRVGSPDGGGGRGMA
jgi:hypothetical protein